jgi:spore coat protein U-like protein
MRRYVRILTVCIGLLAWAGEALAGSTTGNLDISVTVGASVVVTVVTNMDFGTVAAGATNTQAAGLIQVTAPTTVNYQIGLGAGNHLDSSGMRRMANGVAAFAAYLLCHDAACTQVWGDNGLSGGTFPGGNPTAAQTGTGIAQAFQVYGRLPAAPTGDVAYADTVTILVVW